MQRTGYALKVIVYLVELTLHLFPSLPPSLRLIPLPPPLPHSSQSDTLLQSLSLQLAKQKTDQSVLNPMHTPPGVMARLLLFIN